MKRILAVDDEVTILKCFQKILSMHGYDITTSSDPVKALEIMQNSDFDLIMLDIRMPKVTGFDIYEQIKKRNNDVAVLFVTAFPGSFTVESDQVMEMWRKKFSDGNTDILYKPFAVDTLIEKVEALIGPSQANS